MTKRKKKPAPRRKGKPASPRRGVFDFDLESDEPDSRVEPRTPMDLLGRVVGDTRDDVIAILQSLATQRQRNTTFRAVHRALSSWPAAAKRDLPDLVAHVVDATLFSLLVNLEGEYDLRVLARDGKKWVDLREASEAGLHYELSGPDGWVRRFSERPRGRFEPNADDE